MIERKKKEEWRLLLPYILIVASCAVVGFVYALIADRSNMWTMTSWLDFGRFQTPLYLFLLVGFTISFIAPLRIANNQPQSREEVWDCGIMLLWAMGYANLLVGFFPTFWGTTIFFLLGIFIHWGREIAQRKRPAFSPRLVIIATLLYVLYEALTLLWNDIPGMSGNYFRRELWLAIVPIAVFCYPPHRDVVRGFMEYAMRITILYLSAVVLLYLWLCTASGIPITSCFALTKSYLLLPWRYSFPVTLLSLFGWQHYTYLSFIFTVPFLYHAVRTRLISYQGIVLCLYYLLMLSFSIILQSRIYLLFIGVLGVILLVKSLTHISIQRVVAIGLITAAVGVTALLIISPNLLEYFTDSHRLELLRIGANYIGEHPWKGFGLGSSASLIYPFKQGYNAGHFHNQWMQSYLEGGLLSMLFITFVPASFYAVAIRRRLGDLLLAMLFFTLILLIELVFIFPEYLIGMILMLCFLVESNKNVNNQHYNTKWL